MYLAVSKGAIESVSRDGDARGVHGIVTCFVHDETLQSFPGSFSTIYGHAWNGNAVPV